MEIYMSMRYPWNFSQKLSYKVQIFSQLHIFKPSVHICRFFPVPQPVVHIQQHPQLQQQPGHMPPMSSQQTPSASGGPHPPSSGHQTPTPSQLQPQFILPPSAGATPHLAAYQHQVMLQQQAMSQAGSGCPSSQAQQVAYTTVPLQMHYAAHQPGMVAYVATVSQAGGVPPQQQTPHGVASGPMSQQQSGGTGAAHGPPPAHMMMSTPQQAGSAGGQHSMHPQQMGSGSGPGMIMQQGQPPQQAGGGMTSVGHHFVPGHPMQGTWLWADLVLVEWILFNGHLVNHDDQTQCHTLICR